MTGGIRAAAILLLAVLASAGGYHYLRRSLPQIAGTITVAGGLDDALSAATNAIRSNFKAAKDKKATKGA